MKKMIIINLLIYVHTSALSLDHPFLLEQSSTSPRQSIQSIELNQQNQELKLNMDQHSWQIPIDEVGLMNNGDMTLNQQSESGRTSLTMGQNSLFGSIINKTGHYHITTDADGIWATELSKNGSAIEYNSCGLTQHQHQQNMLNYQSKRLNSVTQRAHNNKKQLSTEPAEVTQALDDNDALDVLILYTQALKDKYPGELLQTRFNQYVNESNQVLANSLLDFRVRVVGTEQVPYDFNNSNVEALESISAVLGGAQINGLEGVSELRENLGADLVIMIRPHDIITRGNCGVAFFPVATDGVYDATLGVNMVSDGMSSWSVCTDGVFIHEIGHNLGAGHQRGAGGGIFAPASSAFVLEGKLNTVMGSFGTGRPDRFYEVQAFSNPAIQCGGVPCGQLNGNQPINNSQVIADTSVFVMGYQAAVSQLPIAKTVSNTPDADGDGLSDWQDAFPFNSTETLDSDFDGVGNNTDAFPNNPNETQDTDNDGIGNNLDLDDDADGVPDSTDAFPLDSQESNDSDGDGVGDLTDLFINNSLEQFDFDNDGIGNNQDNDDDNDGVNDIDNSTMDLLVINSGNNRLLRFDAQTGQSKGIEILPTDGLLTFQSDLAYNEQSQTLFYTSSSSVKRLNLMNRQTLGTWVPAFATQGPLIGSGFPTAIGQFRGSSALAVSRIENPLIRSFEGQLTARDGSANWVLDTNVPGPIDMIPYQDNILVLDQGRKIFQITPNGEAQPIGPVVNNWMNAPFAMAESDDTLFVSNTTLNTIGTMDLQSGQFITNLADLDNQGYNSPSGLAINDDILLVAVPEDNVILKYNKNTGDFLGELVSGSGLDKPQRMILVPQLNDRYSNDANRLLQPNAGLWFNPETSGRGFDIQIFNNRLTAIWYTYDSDGLPVWYLSSGELDGLNYSSELQKFTQIDDANAESEVIGSINLSFSSEREAAFSWQIGQVSGSETLTWFEYNRDYPSMDSTGLWGREDGPGWGISVVKQGNISVAIAFIYDAFGDPRWLISQPYNELNTGPYVMDAVFSDTLCPECSGEASSNRISAGSMSLNFSAQPSWSSQATFPAPLQGEWALPEIQLRRFSSVPDRPR